MDKLYNKTKPYDNHPRELKIIKDNIMLNDTSINSVQPLFRLLVSSVALCLNLL